MQIRGLEPPKLHQLTQPPVGFSEREVLAIPTDWVLMTMSPERLSKIYLEDRHPLSQSGRSDKILLRAKAGPVCMNQKSNTQRKYKESALSSVCFEHMGLCTLITTRPTTTMFLIVSIIFWTAFFMQVAMASPGGEGDYTPSLRYPEKPGKIMIKSALEKFHIYYSTDSLPTVYNVDTAQAGANDVSKQLPN